MRHDGVAFFLSGLTDGRATGRAWGCLEMPLQSTYRTEKCSSRALDRSRMACLAKVRRR